MLACQGERAALLDKTQNPENLAHHSEKIHFFDPESA